MLPALVAAASLMLQAWLFRDTAAHPFDACADRARCPEESLDSLLAAREAVLEGLRRRAGVSPAGIDTSRIGSLLRAD